MAPTLRIVIAALIVAAAFVGCAPKPPVIEARVAFSPEQAAFIREVGAGGVAGEAFVRGHDGRVVTCAGLAVDLVAATDYAADRARQMFQSVEGGVVSTFGLRGAAPDPRFQALRRTEVCDASGRFAFANVADGAYYVSTLISWSTPRSRHSYVLAKRIVVAEGAEVDLRLSARP